MEEYKNKKLYTLIDGNNISSKVMLIEDVIDLLNEESNRLETLVRQGVFQPVQKGGNEVTDFGIDYDGAISAGKDGWECDNCGYWNTKENIKCYQCFGG